MSKNLYIAEKPSVAKEFAKALHENFSNKDGYQESENSVVTWCVGHLVTMSYPECYDPALKKWSIATLPFLPKEYKYEIIPDVAKQFNIVKSLLNRPDVTCIYICTDSGREGEYIYRLVDQEAKVPADKERRRVWIDSQTEEEVLRGIREAKSWEAYNNLSDAAYLRAKEDYLMGINFSRILTLKYGNTIQGFLKSEKRAAISVGRVMTCVLGIVVRREREIRDFVKTPFYRVIAHTEQGFDAEFRAVEGSKYYNTPALYKENGFKKREDAEALTAALLGKQATVSGLEKKLEKKTAPLLFNLAELQNSCSRTFKISPDETLKITQELYEKKLVTYPRTDARVLSTAVSKEIYKNISGLKNFEPVKDIAEDILKNGSYKGVEKTKYCDDKKITDHYAIIPTGQTGAYNGLGSLQKSVYELIVRRFLSIFLAPAEYKRVALVLDIGGEKFFANFKMLEKEGYLKATGKKKEEPEPKKADDKSGDSEDVEVSEASLEKINSLKKGDTVNISGMDVKEGETKPPKRYNSGDLILTMENAGQFIEDEELRAQIKGAGIGTSATRAEILSKLVKIDYLALNKKTQIFTPTKLGEMIYEVVTGSISPLLRADLTASWEKGLSQVAEGTISANEYMNKLEDYVSRMTQKVKDLNNSTRLYGAFGAVQKYYS